jgi:outer membrane protein OmpA-like peptidoglycan-associated protein
MSVRWRRTSILVWMLVVLTAPLARAYFFDYGTGVRPTGMGRAYVAVADDVNTINWNPAGLAMLNRYEITTMYASLFSGLQSRLYTGQLDGLGYNYIAAAVPIDPMVGSFGASWSQFSSTFYRENIFTIGYARTLTFTNFDYTTAHVGMNLKIMNWSSDGTDYSGSEGKTGFTADVAILYPLPEKFVVGICLENFIPANMGVTTTEEIPRNFRIGASWSQDLKPMKSFIDSMLVSVEVVNRSYAQNKNTVRFGGEAWFLDGLLAGRLGVNSTEFTLGFSGCYTFEQLNSTKIQLDYNFSLPFYVQKSYGTHRIGLTGSWGKLAGSKVEQAEKVLAESIDLKPEDNMAAEKDAELAAQREAEETRLKTLMAQLRKDIKQVQDELLDVKLKVRDGKFKAIAFQSGRTGLRPGSYAVLDVIGNILAKHKAVKVRVEGHTDKSGDADSNRRISQARAERICEYLISQHLVKKENLLPVGLGDTRPVASNDTMEGQEANRRIEFKVLIPAGMEMEGNGIHSNQVDDGKKESIHPDDIVSYEDLDNMREKLKVYEIKMNADEVEELFKQQHQEKGNNNTNSLK